MSCHCDDRYMCDGCRAYSEKRQLELGDSRRELADLAVEWLEGSPANTMIAAIKRYRKVRESPMFLTSPEPDRSR